jgi:hypothetical protein
MTAPPRAGDIHRTALLAMHDGSQPTLDAAISAHADTGVLLCADADTCHDFAGQAALLTAVTTAARAFGNVAVLAASPQTVITGGVSAGISLANAVVREGASPITPPGLTAIPNRWPVVLIGAETPVPIRMDSFAGLRAVLRVSWSGWVAAVRATSAPAGKAAAPPCVLAAITAAGMGISEAFGATRARPGSDAGFRDITLNLWNPRGDADSQGPVLAHAPCAWWLVGLGHLGQACSWVISWLPYADASAIEVALQDTDRTTPANHSTGVLTPAGSDGIRKTRLVAAALDRTGFDTRIIERRLGPDFRAAPGECHVAIMGVDNLLARRLASAIGWRFAVDLGLGSGPDNFASLLIRRFPAAQTSDAVPAWTHSVAVPVAIPSTPAFSDLIARHDQCGMVELAGAAVGASFVGIVAACLAVAEACRELHGGAGLDVLNLDLLTMDSQTAPATRPADVISAQLRPPDSTAVPITIPANRSHAPVSPKSG